MKETIKIYLDNETTKLASGQKPIREDILKKVDKLPFFYYMKKTFFMLIGLVIILAIVIFAFAKPSSKNKDKKPENKVTETSSPNTSQNNTNNSTTSSPDNNQNNNTQNTSKTNELNKDKTNESGEDGQNADTTNTDSSVNSISNKKTDKFDVTVKNSEVSFDSPKLDIYVKNLGEETSITSTFDVYKDGNKLELKEDIQSVEAQLKKDAVLYIGIDLSDYEGFDKGKYKISKELSGEEVSFDITVK